MDSTLRFIINGVNNSSAAVRQAQQEVARYRQEIQRLTAEEKQRSAVARAALAQERANIAAQRAAANASASNQAAARRAAEASTAATNRARIAQQQYQGALVGQAAASAKAATAGSALTSVLGGIAAGGALAAINALVVAFSALASAIASAVREGLKIKTLDVGATSTFSRILGLDRSTARIFAQDLRAQVAQAGISLPISTADVTEQLTSIQSAVATAEAKLGRSSEQFARDIVGTFDENGRLQQAGIAAQLAILKQQSGGQITDLQITNTISDLLSGADSGQLGRQEFYRKVLGPVIEDIAKAQGKDLDDISGPRRLLLLIEALNKLVSSADISELSNTPEAQLSNFFDTLFNPDKGIFGIARDLNETLPGRQSIVESLSRTVALIFGSDGLIGRITNLFNTGEDPLIAIDKAINQMNDFIEAINSILPAEQVDVGQAKRNVELLKLLFNPGVYVLDKINPGIIVANALRDFIFKAIPNLFNSIGPALDSVGNAIKVVMDSISSWFYGVLEYLNSLPLISGLVPDAPNVGAPKSSGKSTPTSSGPEFFPGYTYQAANGLMPLSTAIALEAAMKPANSDLVIANSSETILTPTQMNSLLGQRANNQQSINFESGAISITQQPGENSESLVRRMTKAFSEELEFRLNAST